MKRVVLCMAAVFAAWMAMGASLAGKYVALKDGEVVFTLVLTEKGAALHGPGDGYEGGVWKRRKVAKHDCVVVKMTELRDWTVAYELSKDLQTLTLLGMGDNLDEIEEDLKEGYRPPSTERNARLKRVDGESDAELMARVDERRESDERNKAWLAREESRRRERREGQALVEAFMKDKQSVLKAKLVYPEKKPETITMPGDGYTTEMKALGTALAFPPPGTYTEEELIAFVDRCDWNRGRYLIVCAFTRDEITAETRRRYAAKFKEWLGDVDEIYLVGFLLHPKTPLDIVKGFDLAKFRDEIMKKELEKRLEKGE